MSWVGPGKISTVMPMSKEEEAATDAPDDPEEPSAFEKLKAWSLDTCTNGIPNVARAEGMVSRVFWILIVLTATVFTVEQMYEAFDKYLRRPVNVNIKYITVPHLEFPAVTVCNINPIRLSAVSDYAHHHPELASILGIGNNAANVSEGHRGAEHHAVRVAFIRMMADMNETYKESLGHQLHDLILHCTYEGKECKNSDFTSFWSSHHGNCFTFNHGYENRTGVHYNSQTGAPYGLKLELNLEQDDYIGTLSEMAAARVILHKANTMPFPDDAGTNAPPGFMTSIASKVLQIDRLPWPFEDECVNYTREDSFSHSIYSYKYDVNYTKAACVKTCLQATIITECKCADPELPFNSTYFSETHVEKPHPGGELTPCVSNEKIECMEKVIERYTQGDLHCDYCPLGCIDILYPEKVSMAQWPSLNHKKTVYESLANHSSHLNKIINGDNTTAPTPTDNLLKIEVYFDELNYENIYQVEAFTWMDLLAALGGVVGLFLGLSVVAIFEFIELGITMLVHCCKKGKKNDVSPIKG